MLNYPSLRVVAVLLGSRPKKIGKKFGWSKRGTIFLARQRSTRNGCCSRRNQRSWGSLEAFPHYRLDARLAKITQEREALAADLDKRLIRRDFDLSRVGDEQRRANLARRYVETADKLREWGAHFRLLQTAKQLGSEWQDKL
jgi:hypothetical protein